LLHNSQTYNKMKTFIHSKVKLLVLWFLSVFWTVDGMAQTGPMVVYDPGGPIGNTIPLGSAASNRRSWIYTPQDFQNSQPGLITRIYILVSGTPNSTFSNFSIRMGATTQTTFTAPAAWPTGLTTVFSAATVTPTRLTHTGPSSGSWFVFDLQTPFLFDNVSNLIVDIEQNGIVNNATTQQANVPGRSVFGSSTGTPSLQDRLAMFGFDWVPSGPCTAPPLVGNTVATPGLVCIGGSTALSISSLSFGQGQTMQWQSSSNGATWTNMMNDTLANITTTVMDTTWYRLAVTCSGVTSFSNPVRVDAIGTSLPGGTYTINSNLPTAGTNYFSFTDFFSAINCGGISGPVTLNVVSGSGPYTESVLIGAVGGTSAINTLTINGNGEVLQFANTNNNQRATLTLDGSSHVTIDGLIIRALNNGTLGYGVQMRNGANNNTLKNCQIDIPLNQTGLTWAGVVLNSGLTPTTYGANPPFNNSIQNNIIAGGYYGVSIMGTSATAPAVGNKVLNNQISNYHFFGLHSGAQEDYEYIGNSFPRPSRPSYSSYYGVYCIGNHLGGNISRNAFHDPFGTTRNTSLMYPLYVLNASGTAAKPNHAYNNIFYNLNNNGTLYTMWNSGSNFWNFYHNSLHVDDPNPTAGLTYMIFISGAASNVNVLNNTVFMRRGGTSVKQAIRVEGTGTNRVINNNGYFVDFSIGNTSFGHLGTTSFPSFANWVANNGNGWDNLSVFDNPNFTFPAGGLLIPAAGSYDNIGQNLTAIVPRDYFDSLRTITPDPGAFEFLGPPCSNPVGFNISSVNSTSITVAWTQPGTQVSQWDIEWGPVGFTPGTAGGTQVTTGNNPYTITPLIPGSCYDLYIRANCASLGLPAGSWVGPVTTCLPWTFDLSMVEMVSPNAPRACGVAAMPVTAIIHNNGETPIAGVQLHAVFTGAITATINTTYAGPLASGATDTVVIGTVNSAAGGYADVLFYHSWAADQNPVNDSIAVDSLLFLPELPQQLPSFACAKDDSVTIAMQPFPGVAYLWYDQATAGSLINVGDNFRVPTSAPGPYFVEYQSGRRDSLFTMNQGGSGCGAGNMFDLIPQRVLSISGFDIRPFSTNAAMPVSVFMVTGSHLSLTGQAGWTLVAQGTVNATVNVLTRFNLPNPVLLQPNQTYGFYVQFDASYTVGANNYSNADLQFISGNGNCSPFDYCCTPRTFNGAIHYEIAGCASQRSPVQATVFQDTAVADFSFTQTGPGEFFFDGSNAIGHRFEWFFGDGNTGVGMSTTHTYLNSGTFTVTLVVTDTACNTVDSMQVTVTSTVSLEEFQILQNLKVFPNPNRGVFNIEFEMEGTRDLYLRLISPTGQLITQEHNQRIGGIFKKTIDMSGLSKGVYILQIQTEKGIISRRLTLM
jgi:hypothetical protein